MNSKCSILPNEQQPEYLPGNRKPRASFPPRNSNSNSPSAPLQRRQRSRTLHQKVHNLREYIRALQRSPDGSIAVMPAHFASPSRVVAGTASSSRSPTCERRRKKERLIKFLGMYTSHMYNITRH